MEIKSVRLNKIKNDNAQPTKKNKTHAEKMQEIQKIDELYYQDKQKFLLENKNIWLDENVNLLESQKKNELSILTNKNIFLTPTTKRKKFCLQKLKPKRKKKIKLSKLKRLNLNQDNISKFLSNQNSNNIFLNKLNRLLNQNKFPKIKKNICGSFGRLNTNRAPCSLSIISQNKILNPNIITFSKIKGKLND